MGNIGDESLLMEFVAEGQEHLASIEPDLLAMESQGADVESEIVNRVFRAIHSIKGAAGFFGFERLKQISHVMESVLMRIRDGKMLPEPHIMDRLLAGIDVLSRMFDDIQASEGVVCDEEAAALNKLLEDPSAGADSAATGQPPATPTGVLVKAPEFDFEFDVDREMLTACVANGQKIYVVRLELKKDIEERGRTVLDVFSTMDSMGVVIDHRLDTSAIHGLDDCLDASLVLFFVYATVLETDLVRMGLELENNQLCVAVHDVVINNRPIPSKPSTPEPQPEAEAPPESSDQETELPTAEEVVAAAQETAPTPPAAASADSAPAATGQQTTTLESIRVRVDLLNQMMDLAGELVLSRNQLLRTLGEYDKDIQGLPAILQNLDLVTSSLQERIMQTRMQPIGNVFAKIPRIIRSISQSMGKEIELETHGAEVELDKSIIEILSDPVTHIIRNCCDHGIETTQERQKLKKTPAGHIRLAAFHESGQVNILIEDDGRGIDAEKVAAKAVEKGAITAEQAARMSTQEKLGLIFLPGLSTAQKVTDVSGRGVGMDVVRNNIEKIGGAIEVDSEVGMGTTVTLRLPLTLAIIPSLIVRVAEHRFAVPQVNLVELVWVRANEVAERIERVGDGFVLRLRGHLLPLVRMADVLGLERVFFDVDTGEYQPDRRQNLSDRRGIEKAIEDDVEIDGERREKRRDRRNSWRSDIHIMVVRVGSNQYGLVVDELFDVEEIVVKPLSNYIKDCRCFAGSTIMGDGRVAMIIDVGGVATMAKLAFAEADAETKRREEELRQAELARGERRSVLLFSNHPEEVFALPLASIARLETLEVDRIEQLGSREFVNLRGEAYTLVRMENQLPVRPMPEDRSEAYLIIPKSQHGTAGILASEIVDTVETEIALSHEGIAGRGVVGSAILDGRMTVFLEPAELLNKEG